MASEDLFLKLMEEFSNISKPEEFKIVVMVVNVLVLEHALDGNNIWFKGSGHMNFTDLPLFAPPLAKLLGTGSIDSESCIRQMNQIVLQFYDCKLKNGGELPLQEWYE